MRQIQQVLLLCLLFSGQVAADDWPQWQGPLRDGIWREKGVIRDLSAGTPDVTWRVKVAGGYSQPAIAAGRVFVTDYVRTSGDSAPSPDVRNKLEGDERVLCFDEKTGDLIWKREYARPYEISYPAGPRCTPTVDGDRVYTLGAEGDLLCLSVSDGKIIWSRNLAEDFGTKAPIWGYAAHPLVHGNKLICLVGGDGSAAVAFDKMTGKELWRSLTTPNIGYAPPAVINAARVEQLLIWHSRSLNALNPETGSVYWSEPLQPDYEMSIAPPVYANNILYVAGIKNKSMALQMDRDKPGAKVLWRGRNGLGVAPSHCPVVADPDDPNFVYGVDRGGLRCVNLQNGKHMWETFELMENKRIANAGTIFITGNDDRFYLLSETGRLWIAKMSPKGFQSLGKSDVLIEPTHNAFGRLVVWCAPAFANKSMYVRNDKELVRVDLAAN